MNSGSSGKAAAPRRVAVVGGGWSGLAAAVRSTELGHRVTLFEMAPALGGRARTVEVDGLALDNGQHILIGAYTDTLALMRRVGVHIDELMLRMPLALQYPDGSGLRLPPGPAAIAFSRGVLGASAWPLRDRLSMLATALGWLIRGFRCDPAWTVARLSSTLPESVRRDLIEPLSVAALNTPSDRASASVLLRVLRDALFGARGGADLMLPLEPLGSLLPEPAAGWLSGLGADIRLRTRVESIDASQGGWCLDGEPFDAVVLACTPQEASRLVLPHAPDWARRAGAFEYEPIVTVYVRSEGTRLAQPMLALHANETDAPAQFVFDHGWQPGGVRADVDGRLAFVVSGARQWLEHGTQAVTEAVMAQARHALGAQLRGAPQHMRTLVEKRATFACVPGLDRPQARVAKHLAAAGDYTEGPYPATLEGAVRSGLRAALIATGAG